MVRISDSGERSDLASYYAQEGVSPICPEGEDLKTKFNIGVTQKSTPYLLLSSDLKKRIQTDMFKVLLIMQRQKEQLLLEQDQLSSENSQLKSKSQADRAYVLSALEGMIMPEQKAKRAIHHQLYQLTHLNVMIKYAACCYNCFLNKRRMK